MNLNNMQSSTASHFSPLRLPQSYTAFNSFLHNLVAKFTDYYDPWETYVECDFAALIKVNLIYIIKPFKIKLSQSAFTNTHPKPDRAHNK